MKKVIALLLGLMMVFVCLAGCASNNDSAVTATEAPVEEPVSTVEPEETASTEEFVQVPATSTEKGQYSFPDRYLGLSWNTLAVPFFVVLSEQIQAQAEAAGTKCDVVSADFDVAKQIEQLENLASMGVTDIIIIPLDVDALRDTMKKLRAQGINIHSFAYDFGPDPDCYDSCTYANQYAIGQTIADSANDWINGKWPDAAAESVEVAVITLPIDKDNIERDKGILDEIAKNEKIKLVKNFELTSMESIDAQNAVDMILMEYPTVKVIITHFASMALAGDERALLHSEIDRDNFAIISGDFDDELGRRMLASLTNDSLIRGSGTYSPDTYRLFEVCMGMFDDQLDEFKRYNFDVFKITPETC